MLEKNIFRKKSIIKFYLNKRSQLMFVQIAIHMKTNSLPFSPTLPYSPLQN